MKSNFKCDRKKDICNVYIILTNPSARALGIPIEPESF